MMTEKRRQRGLLGENAAVFFLKEKGYIILERNFSCNLGEIDLIARDGGTFVFVEVKTRTSLAFGAPQESVDQRKQYRLSRLASYYVNRYNLGGQACRFDVIAVMLDREDKVISIEHIKNAF